MKTIGVIPNTYKDTDFSFTTKVIDWIISKEHKPIVTGHISQIINRPELGINIKDIYNSADLLLVLGGDGTILRVAKYAAINNTPILGINLGTLGYLTDVEKSDCFVALEKYFSNDYTVEKRMMLEANTLSTDTENETLIALNDVCITRGFFGNLICLELYINNKFIDIYKADGIIVSTPTGSTAYNLSAGGPILKPDSKMIAITPICPHMLHSRSFVISSEDKISFKIINKKSNDILLNMDGQNIIPIKDQDIVNITGSSFYTSIIKTNNLGFYDILRKKMVGFRGSDDL